MVIPDAVRGLESYPDTSMDNVVVILVLSRGWFVGDFWCHIRIPWNRGTLLAALDTTFDDLRFDCSTHVCVPYPP